MQPKKSYRVISIGLLILPLIWISYRMVSNSSNITFEAFDHQYSVDYNFIVRSNKDYWVKTYLPQNDERQAIQFNPHSEALKIIKDEENLVAKWAGKTENFEHLKLSFKFKGKAVKYDISDQIEYFPSISINSDDYLLSTDYIQSDHPEIKTLSQTLRGDSRGLKDILNKYYDFTLELPSNGTNELTDALTALRNREASCNGKSRLLVALCRSQGIPARMIGGIIMETSDKKTSHAWVEILINDVWVPFDPLNGYFAALPAHYLKLYSGDNFLITRSSGVTFDYQYNIEEERNNAFSHGAIIDLWKLGSEEKISSDTLKILLLLPLGALLIGILKNVIGFKTIGVFLPVLISVALMETGLLEGLALFTIIVTIVACLNYPLTKWGIQHTAKLTLMMSAVIITILILIIILSNMEGFNAATPLFFPFIILTLVSEKVARTIDEEGLKTATDMYAQTLLVTVIIFFVLNSVTIQNFLITFPEVLISFAGINLMLGRWVGFRVFEYSRFLNTVKF